jgi:fructosamine-3-kinase
MTAKNLTAIAQHISQITGRPFQVKKTSPLAGGDINQAFLLEDQQQRYFVKCNHHSLVDMFAAEFSGLQALAATHTIRVPQPISYGQTNEQSFLVLEYVSLHRHTPQSETLLGQQLAQMHQQLQPYYGWHIDNTIGSTPQPNPRTSSWIDFYRDYRLVFQFELLAKKGYGGKLQTLGEKLCLRLGDFFTDYQPQPALLHGDLWGGNVASDELNQPIIFDPACYFGDREADLAMTELFGGFSQHFQAAYHDVWPIDVGYKTRKTLYHLYHILNHANLFGGGYAKQAEQMIATLLSA